MRIIRVSTHNSRRYLESVPGKILLPRLVGDSMKYTVMGAHYKLKGGCWVEGMGEPPPFLASLGAIPPLLELHNEYRQ